MGFFCKTSFFYIKKSQKIFSPPNLHLCVHWIVKEKGTPKKVPPIFTFHVHWIVKEKGTPKKVPPIFTFHVHWIVKEKGTPKKVPPTFTFRVHWIVKGKGTPKKVPPTFTFRVHWIVKGKKVFQKGGATMGNVTNTDTIAANSTELDMEIADVLIAISVITRQLAKKITAKNMPKEETNNA